MNQFSMLLKKYSIPLLFFIMGLIMLIVGVTKSQGAMFMIASFMMFIAGGLSIMYSTGKFKTGFLYTIGIAAGIAGIFTVFMSWKSVHDTSTYNKNYVQCKSIAKQNLQDIRYIQKVYAEKNGTYMSNWDEFKEFTQTGTIPYVDARGVVPNRKIDDTENAFLYKNNPPIDNTMSDVEAYQLSKWTEGPNWQRDFANFKRDTIQVSLLKTKFQNTSYKEGRKNAGFYPFSVDSLPVIPFTNGKKMWKLETKDSVQMGETKVPAILVSGKIPYAKIKGKDNDTEVIFFGSLSSNSTDGSWEEE